MNSTPPVQPGHSPLSTLSFLYGFNAIEHDVVAGKHCRENLEEALLSRKNSYFYKTARGAHVGDVYMSLIHTAELVNANPFDYLTTLQK
jgi:hypothetical protein